MRQSKYSLTIPQIRILEDKLLLNLTDVGHALIADFQLIFSHSKCHLIYQRRGSYRYLLSFGNAEKEANALYQLIPKQIHYGEMPFFSRINPDGALKINDTQH